MFFVIRKSGLGHRADALVSDSWRRDLPEVSKILGASWLSLRSVRFSVQFQFFFETTEVFLTTRLKEENY